MARFDFNTKLTVLMSLLIIVSCLAPSPASEAKTEVKSNNAKAQSDTQADAIKIAGEQSESSSGDILRQLNDLGRFNILIGYLEKSKVDRQLIEKSGITLLAPTDEAFASLFEQLNSDVALAEFEETPNLRRVLSYHILPEEVTSYDIINAHSPFFKTLESSEVLIFEKSPLVFSANDAVLQQFDIETESGIIHVIDKVLLPDTAMKIAEEFKTAGKPQSNWRDKYKDILNGIVAGEREEPDIVKIIQDRGISPTFAKLARASVRGDALMGEDATLFVPVEEAFRALPEGTVEKWLDPANKDRLRAIVRNHKVPVAIKIEEVVDIVEDPLVAQSQKIIKAKPVGYNHRLRTCKGAHIIAGKTIGSVQIYLVDKVLMPSGE